MTAPTYPPHEIASASVHGSGSSTEVLYKIEVRTSYHTPKVLGEGKDKFVIDHCWRALPIVEALMPWGINIPVRRRWHGSVEFGLVPYVAAEAHRWGFLAHLDAADWGGSLCIETRLVAVRLKCTHDTEEVGVSESLRGVMRNSLKLAPRSPTENGEEKSQPLEPI